VQRLWKSALHYEQDYMIVYDGTVNQFKAILNENGELWYNSGDSSDYNYCPDLNCIKVICSNGLITFQN